MSDRAAPPPLPPDDPRQPDVLREVVFAPIGGEGLVQQAARRLAEAIGLGLLKTGERLPPEAQLAEWFEISAMTLREALAILREGGFLETRRGRGGGTFIKRAPAMPPPSEVGQRLSNVSHAFLLDLTDYRRAISGESAALAAERIKDEEVEELEGLADGLVGEERLDAYRRGDAQLHIMIATASRSGRLARAETELQLEFNTLIKAISSALLTPFVPSMAEGSNREHAQIVGKIRERDPEGAREAVHAHVESTVGTLRGLITPQITHKGKGLKKSG